MTEEQIIAALVKPPVGWLENHYGDSVSFLVNTEKGRFVYGCDLAGIFYIQTPDGEKEGFDSLAAAQAAAEADYRARIGAALDLEKVAKLVEAAGRYADRYMQDETSEPELCVPGQHEDAKAVFAALAAFRVAP